MNIGSHNLKRDLMNAIGLWTVLLLAGCLAGQTPPAERNPALFMKLVDHDTSRAVMIDRMNQQLEAPEISFDAQAGVPFYFHQSKWLVTVEYNLWVNDTPQVRLFPMKKDTCDGVVFFSNEGPNAGIDFSKDFVEGDGSLSRVRLRLEEVRLDTFALKMSWMELCQ